MRAGHGIDYPIGHSVSSMMQLGAGGAMEVEMRYPEVQLSWLASWSPRLARVAVVRESRPHLELGWAGLGWVGLDWQHWVLGCSW